jgi:hypothetical protein
MPWSGEQRFLRASEMGLSTIPSIAPLVLILLAFNPFHPAKIGFPNA